MNNIKIIKKYVMDNERLLFVLDEPISIHNLIFEIRSDIEDVNKLNIFVLESIKQLLQSGLYIIGDLKPDYELDEWNLSLDENLLKVKNILYQKNDALLWDVWFDLSKLGKEKAKEYLLKKIRIKDKILINNENLMSLETFMDLIKEEFPNDSFEEIKDKAVSLFYYLFNRDFIKVGTPNDSFTLFDSNFDLDGELTKLGRMPKADEIARIINTDPTNALVEKWKECRGRLVNDWYELIDRN